MHTIKNIKIVGNRSEIRKKLFNLFLKEKPGKGTGNLSSKYTYYVETLTNKKRIFIKRPARFNKGIDFEINVENTYFTGKKRNSTRPSHNNILNDLRKKKVSNKNEYTKILKLIKKIYYRNEVDNRELNKIKINSGYPLDLTLKVIKWMFIEQDITYWNYSGRKIFYESIKKI